jgi:hypothetical protein
VGSQSIVGVTEQVDFDGEGIAAGPGCGFDSRHPLRCAGQAGDDVCCLGLDRSGALVVSPFSGR